MNFKKTIYSDEERYKKWQRIEVVNILENEFVFNRNDAERRASLFFSPGFMPKYYFYSHHQEDIANHVVAITQLLDANEERIAIETKDGSKISYFYNVGTNVPGRLLAVLEENSEVDVVGLDSIITRSGYRIVSLERRDFAPERLPADLLELARKFEDTIRETGSPHAGSFLDSLPPDYMKEEILADKSSPRILRHLRMYEQAMANPGVNVRVTSVVDEDDDAFFDRHEKIRFSFCRRNPEKHFINHVLEVFKDLRINLVRTYFDLFIPRRECDQDTVAIGSIYLDDDSQIEEVQKRVIAITDIEALPENDPAQHQLERSMTRTIRVLSDSETSDDEAAELISKLKDLTDQNRSGADGAAHDNFLLNVVTEFFEAAKVTGIADNPAVLKLLLKFESVSEFFVESRIAGKKRTKNAYRLRHSSARGPGKGGLRIHPIAELSEVAALAFVMTWKCAKSGISLGGAKGGVLMHPSDFQEPLDYVDSIGNFGKSLFLETGSFLDVPAGDVNCGPKEIGMIFRGFKAALRDLATLVYGSKFGVAYIGKRLVSVKRAREILENHFGVDAYDSTIIQWLVTSDEYLNLTLASQITGKPEMGIEARNGATGLGVVYSLLAAVGRLYLDGNWDSSEPLTDEERNVLKAASGLDRASFVAGNVQPLITDEAWKLLNDTVYPKLLADKRVALQGVGKVGASVLQELDQFGVNLVGVADVSGAIIGDHISIETVLQEVGSGGKVLNITDNVQRTLNGTVEGGAVVTVPCDILLPCALENAITRKNVDDIQAGMIICGANGPISPAAAQSLSAKNILVVYDFLANSGGVIASYFEWLRGLTERRRFEAQVIRSQQFEIDEMTSFIAADLRPRILPILESKEDSVATANWRKLMRDILFVGLNEDYTNGARLGVRLKVAGMVDAQLRVLATILIGLPFADSQRIWQSFENRTRELLIPYLQHPEVTERDEERVAQQLIADSGNQASDAQN